MEDFTYHSLFETKGIEYLIIIAFFLILIPFWLLLRRKPGETTVDQTLAWSSRATLVPGGIIYDPHHTWMFLQKSGKALIGLDRLIIDLTGADRLDWLVTRGQPIQKGEPIALLKHREKALEIKSPLTGTIREINEFMTENPKTSGTKTFNNDWMIAVEPANWLKETQTAFIGNQAREWLKNEAERMRSFILNTTFKQKNSQMAMALQDGGEPEPGVLAGLPDEVWQRFQQSFM